MFDNIVITPTEILRYLGFSSDGSKRGGIYGDLRELQIKEKEIGKVIANLKKGYPEIINQYNTLIDEQYKEVDAIKKLSKQYNKSTDDIKKITDVYSKIDKEIVKKLSQIQKEHPKLISSYSKLSEAGKSEKKIIEQLTKDFKLPKEEITSIVNSYKDNYSSIMSSIAEEDKSIFSEFLKLKDTNISEADMIKNISKITGESETIIAKIIEKQKKASSELSKIKTDLESTTTDKDIFERGLDSPIDKILAIKDRIMGGSALFAGQMKYATAITFSPIIASVSSLISNLNKIESITKETGFFADSLTNNFQSMAMESQRMAISGKLQSDYIGNSFILATQLEKSMGRIGKVSTTTLNTIGFFRHTIGMSNEESVALLNTLHNINGQSVDMNTEFIKTITILGNINNVAPKLIMEDISNNADFFAKYMGNANVEMVKASIIARRLGVEVGTYVKMLEGLDGVETIIEKQSQISMFIGRQIDLVGVATAQFVGDVPKAMKLMNLELKKITKEQFNQPFIRGMLAQQLGLSNQELVRIYNNVHNIGSESEKINTSYQKSMETFNENFSARGLSVFKRDVELYILNPLNNFFSTGTEQAQSFFDMISGIIRFSGSFIMSIMKTLHAINKTIDFITFGNDTLSSSIKGISALLASFYVASRLVGVKQTSLLTDIRNILTKQYLTKDVKAGGGFLKSKTAMGLGLVGLGATTALLGYSIGKSDKETTGGRTGSGLLGAIGQGAVQGGILGATYGTILPGKGTLIGGAAGAIGYGAIGGASYLMGNQMNQGGILINKPTRIGNTILGDGQNGTQNEAVIPLSSQRGKEIMQMDLSDNSIKKLVKGIKEMEIPIQIFLKNNTDKEQEYYDILARPSNALATVR
jgi:hypothetical protein